MPAGRRAHPAIDGAEVAPSAHGARRRETTMSAWAKPVVIPTTAEYAAKFWQRVEKRRQNECWPWLGSMHPEGRGYATAVHTSTTAARIALHLSGTPVTQGRFVCHTCDNPACCNPGHLYLGTQADNMRDAMLRKRFSRGTATHCQRGHEFSESNTYTHTKSGARQCRTCKSQRTRKYRGQSHVLGR